MCHWSPFFPFFFFFFTPPLIKINGPSHCWPAYYQFIHQMGWDAASVAPYVAKTLTVLEQTSTQLWGKVSTSGPNKWYGLNGSGNDFYPSSLIWPGGRWCGGCWGLGHLLFYNFTPGHYLDLMLLEQDKSAWEVEVWGSGRRRGKKNRTTKMV